MKKLLANLFNVSLKVNPKPVLRLMDQYFNGTDNFLQPTINNVEVKENKTTLLITITTSRPGLLIGKGGRYIDALKEYIESQLKKKVTIHIEESKLWIGLYKN